VQARFAKGAGADRALRDGDELAFDAFYAEMKDWGRFELVDSPEQAEVVLELSYSSPPAARSRARDPRLTAKFYDPKTGHVLGTAWEERNQAVFCKNRRKNLLEAVDELVAKLKTRMEATP